MQDAENRVTQDFKNEDDVIVLLGENKGSLDGSEYLYRVHNLKKGNPQIDIEREKAVQEACLEMIQSGIINSAHDCSEGGLAICLAESCMTNESHMIGAVVEVDDLKRGDIRLDDILFGEAPSRILVSAKRDNMQRLEDIVNKYSIPYYKLGTVCGTQLIVRYNNQEVIDLNVTALSHTWRNAIPARVK